MPSTLDPEPGFVVSANNAPRADAEDLPLLGIDWLDGYRAAALHARLASRADWDVATTAELQRDVTSLPWAELRETILGVAADSAEGRLALGLLRGWDGRVAATSPAASVFELLLAELAAATAREAAPTSWRWAIGAGFGGAITRTAFGARTVSRLSASIRGRSDAGPVVHAALRAAIGRLTVARGPRPERWAWGDVRPLWLRHVLGAVKPFDRAFNLGPVRIGGDTNTIAQAGVRPLDPLGPTGAIANHRMVVDLADPDRSRYVLAGGQSGNPLSPHYGDLFGLWVRGEAVPIAWTPRAVTDAVVDELVLVPIGSGLASAGRP
jgi:penicillin amidase